MLGFTLNDLLAQGMRSAQGGLLGGYGPQQGQPQVGGPWDAASPAGGVSRFSRGGLAPMNFAQPMAQSFSAPQLMSMAQRMRGVGGGSTTNSGGGDELTAGTDAVSAFGGAGPGGGTVGGSGANIAYQNVGVADPSGNSSQDMGGLLGNLFNGGAKPDGSATTGLGGFTIGPDGLAKPNTTGVSNSVAGAVTSLLGGPGLLTAAGNWIINNRAQNGANAFNRATGDANPNLNGQALPGAPTATTGPAGTGAAASAAASAAAANAAAQGLSDAEVAKAAQNAANSVLAGKGIAGTFADPEYKADTSWDMGDSSLWESPDDGGGGVAGWNRTEMSDY